MQKSLRSALLRMNGSVSTEHPPAEILAAFQEKNLLPAERELVVAHLGRCHACRECLSITAESQANQRTTVRIWKYACGIAASLFAVGVLAQFNSNQSSKPEILPTQRAAVRGETSAAPSKSSEIVWRFGGADGSLSLQKSEDGGKAWMTVALDGNFRVQSLAWNESTTWVRSEGGEVRVSRDAGSHWTPMSFSVHKQLADAAIRSNSSLANSSGKVTVITEEGNRWTRMNNAWRADKVPGR